KGHTPSTRKGRLLSIQRSHSLSIRDSRGYLSSIRNLRGHDNNHSSTIIDSRRFGNNRSPRGYDNMIKVLSKAVNILTEKVRNIKTAFQSELEELFRLTQYN
ncbi:8237_t:CDS:2, partial [Funneliformis caledonium]